MKKSGILCLSLILSTYGTLFSAAFAPRPGIDIVQIFLAQDLSDRTGFSRIDLVLDDTEALSRSTFREIIDDAIDNTAAFIAAFSKDDNDRWYVHFFDKTYWDHHKKDNESDPINKLKVVYQFPVNIKKSGEVYSLTQDTPETQGDLYSQEQLDEAERRRKADLEAEDLRVAVELQNRANAEAGLPMIDFPQQDREQEMLEEEAQLREALRRSLVQEDNEQDDLEAAMRLSLEEQPVPPLVQQPVRQNYPPFTEAELHWRLVRFTSPSYVRDFMRDPVSMGRLLASENVRHYQELMNIIRQHQR